MYFYFDFLLIMTYRVPIYEVFKEYLFKNSKNTFNLLKNVENLLCMRYSDHTSSLIENREPRFVNALTGAVPEMEMYVFECTVRHF